MTKGELIKLLENVPNDFDIRVCTWDAYGYSYEPIIENVEINNTLQTVYLQIDEDEFAL